MRWYLAFCVLLTLWPNLQGQQRSSKVKCWTFILVNHYWVWYGSMYINIRCRVSLGLDLWSVTSWPWKVTVKVKGQFGVKFSKSSETHVGTFKSQFWALLAFDLWPNSLNHMKNALRGLVFAKKTSLNLIWGLHLLCMTSWPLKVISRSEVNLGSNF